MPQKYSSSGKGELRSLGKIPVLLVDDHPFVLEGLASVINRESDLAVCGTACSVREALQKIEELVPAICIVDVSLDASQGIDLVKEMQDTHPHLPVIMMSMHDEKLYAERALRAGAKGYLMKREPPQKLLQAIRKVLNGDVFFSETITAQLLQRFSSAHKNNELPMQCLTDRELEVLELTGRGITTRNCAKQLHLSMKTVQSHREHIKKKLELSDHASLVQFAQHWVESNH